MLDFMVNLSNILIASGHSTKTLSIFRASMKYFKNVIEDNVQALFSKTLTASLVVTLYFEHFIAGISLTRETKNYVAAFIM